MKTLILFTHSYPYSYSNEDTFLREELVYLSQIFQKVIIVPFYLKGKKDSHPDNVEIEEGLSLVCCPASISDRLRFSIYALKMRLFYKEIVKRPLTLIQVKAVRRLLGNVSIAGMICNWIVKFIESKKIDLTHTIFYTYWLSQIALGIELAKKFYPSIKLISRVHGGCLYEDQYIPKYIPCHYEMLKNADYLFPVSGMCKEFIIKKYPALASRCEISRLGVRESGFITGKSQNDLIRMVSCSSIISLKRVDLIVQVMQSLGQSRPKNRFEWYHIGDGPLRNEVEEFAKQIIPENVKYCFMGYLPNEEVMTFYKNNMIDLFITMSTSEGVPVTIMEAFNCGIPAIAPAVGGIADLVSNENGILMNPNPTIDEIVSAICKFMDEPEVVLQKKQACKMTWKDKYNADENYPRFANRLIHLCSN